MSNEHAAQIADANEQYANESAALEAAANEAAARAAEQTETGQTEETAPPLKIKASVLKKSLEMAKEFAQSDRNYATRNIKYQTEAIAKELEKAEKAEEKHRANAALWAEVWTVLENGGFKPESMIYDRWTIRVTTTEKKLAKLAKLIGQLDTENADKYKQSEPGERKDAPHGVITIVARSKKYDFVRVKWEHTLTPKDKCKIVSRVVTDIQCDV